MLQLCKRFTCCTFSYAQCGRRAFDSEMEKLLLRSAYAFPANLASTCNPESVYYILKECWNSANEDLLAHAEILEHLV